MREATQIKGTRYLGAYLVFVAAYAILALVTGLLWWKVAAEAPLAGPGAAQAATIALVVILFVLVLVFVGIKLALSSSRLAKMPVRGTIQVIGLLVLFGTFLGDSGWWLFTDEVTPSMLAATTHYLSLGLGCAAAVFLLLMPVRLPLPRR